MKDDSGRGAVAFVALAAAVVFAAAAGFATAAPFATATAFAGATAFPAAAQARSYADWYQAMVTAFGEGDDVAMAQAAEAALRLRPRFPSMMVNLAIARVRLGQIDAAMDLLEAVADMGLAYPLQSSEQFAEVSVLPRFRRVIAKMEANSSALGVAEIAFRLPDPEFFPEGLAADADGESFFIGSVRSGAILRVDATGDARPFARLPWSVLGMKIDPRGGLLWVAVSGLEQRVDLDDERLGRAGVVAVDLEDGTVRGEYLLPRRPDSAERVVGDLVVAEDGTVYASDSLGGGVWVLDPAGKELEPLLNDGTLASPQGIDLDPSGFLYVADYNGGVFRVDPASGDHARLASPDDVTTYGIDGLYVADGSLVAVQNGISPHRVVRLELGDRGLAVTGAAVLLRADPRFGEPTLGALADDTFYVVANSPWAQFGDAAHPPEPDSLQEPLVLRLAVRD